MSSYGVGVFGIVLHRSKGSVLNEKFYTKDWFPGQEGWQQFNATFLDSGDVAHRPGTEGECHGR